ncbi:MAG: radical SAM protein [Omnitrophica bacterium]|nr:radical SAM protein [Candidatus Omnitrophota bacterium]
MRKRIRNFFLTHVPILIKAHLLHKVPLFYPFLEIKPSSSTIMITDRCNMRCRMCGQWQKPGRKELETGDWKRIIGDLKKNGIRNVHFTGGEPLLRADLAELVSFSTKRGLTAGLTTNGILLRDEALQRLIDSGLRSIAISVDAVGDSYEVIRGVAGSFVKIKEALSLVSGMRKNKTIDAYMHFTLMKGNLDKLKSVKALADEYGLPLGICLLDKSSSIFALEKNKREFWITEDEDFERLENILEFLKYEKIKSPGSLLINFPAIEFIKEYFKSPRQAHIPCISSQERVIIDPYGNLLGGCMSMGSFGNINVRPFGGIKKEKKYRVAKKNMFYKKCDGCSCGYFLNIRWFAPLIFKDFLQRIGRFELTGRKKQNV